MHLGLIHTDVWQKPTQYCKAVIFQLKINKFLKTTSSITLDQWLSLWPVNLSHFYLNVHRATQTVSHLMASFPWNSGDTGSKESSQESSEFISFPKTSR